MIAHVAEAGEDRGRVVVRLGAFAPSSPAALAASVHVARAFQSEIEAIFIEDPDAAAALAHERARILTPAGARLPAPDPAHTGALTHFAHATQREIATLARAAAVTFSGQVVRQDTLTALSAACAERGPWNIIAFAEPVSSPERAAVLNDALTRVWGTTAFVAAGSSARWRPGPILVVVEDIERLSGLLRAAKRLAAIGGEDVLLLPAAIDDIALDWLESEIALTLGEGSGVTILPRAVPSGRAEPIQAVVAKFAPRLVLARHGGLVVPAEKTARALAPLPCPVFIVH